jgi:flagellar motility protein MotE (MotC chaperone)
VANKPADTAGRDSYTRSDKSVKDGLDRERDIDALKDKIKVQEKTIDDLKKNLTIHVDTKVTRNTTTTETHVYHE